MDVDFSKPFRVDVDILFEGMFYTEGPVADGQGGVFFTTLSGGNICHWQSGKGVSVWASGGWPNGQARALDGGMLVCDSQNGRVIRYSKVGEFSRNEIDGRCADQLVTVPNDVTVDTTGGFYFTDSVRKEGQVFYKAADGKEKLVVSGLDYPNGLVLSAGQDRLFIAESYQNRIICLKLSAPGVMAGRSVFCRLPEHPSARPERNLPDGLAMDKKGRIWVAHYGMGAIQVVNEDGRLEASLSTGMPLTSNLCFSDDHAVIVTGGSDEPGPGAVLKLIVENHI